MARSITMNDLFRLDILIDAQIAPNGQSIAYITKHAEVEKNSYTTALYVLEIGSPEPQAVEIATPGINPLTPRWSPDGTALVFTCEQAGVRQLYLHHLDAPAQTATQLTSLRRGAANPVWSPDGKRIALTSTEGEGMADDLRQTAGGPIRHIQRRQYRMDGLGYLDDRFSHIWVLNLADRAIAQLSAGSYDDIAPAWSPDSQQIVFLSNRLNDIHVSFCAQVYVLDVPEQLVPANNGENIAVRCLSTETELASNPVWSPDGVHIAYIGRYAGVPAGSNTNIFIYSVGDKELSSLTKDFDRSIGGGVFGDTWSNYVPSSLLWLDAGHVCFTACDQGRVSIYQADLAANVTLVVGGDRTHGFVSHAALANRLAYISGNCTIPCDVYTCSADGSAESRLTAINDQVLEDLALQQPQLLKIKSYAPLETVDAWLLRPSGYEPGTTYPLVQYIHGGPHSTFGYTFFFDMQLFAAQGWNVLFVNPRGSQGYGNTAATCNIGQWGNGDWPEQEAALDHAIQLGGVDPTRIGAIGLSYGGYMVNWIIGHSQRYAAAISENGIANLSTFYTTSDIGWFWIERELGLPFWEHVGEYLERSPLYHAPNVKTPLLLLNGEQDYRCPLEQSEQFYAALRAQNVACEMVRFPGETHMFLMLGKPRSRQQRREQILRWFALYFGAEAPR